MKWTWKWPWTKEPVCIHLDVIHRIETVERSLERVRYEVPDHFVNTIMWRLADTQTSIPQALIEKIVARINALQLRRGDDDANLR